jgi:hypothetical protein
MEAETEADCCVIPKRNHDRKHLGHSRVEQARTRIQTVANEMSITLSAAECAKFSLLMIALEDDAESELKISLRALRNP